MLQIGNCDKGMRKIYVLLSACIVLFFLNFASLIFAQENSTKCQNRYLTLVNPVRDRGLWYNKELKPLNDQYSYISKNNFAATWLLQYDVLKDEELLNQIKIFDSKQEKGIFLEISPGLAADARVIYPHSTSWYFPQAVFLSGYSQSDRKDLIDVLFEKFKEQFGFYPKSVGAWWIDSFSLNYLYKNYGITSAMIVADQKTTDSYGVWGQWWGMPYYPSKANILSPASSLENKLDVAIIQWAQRDLSLAYGEGTASSNFSLQANDYSKLGKSTDHFINLSQKYLDCRNLLGQITVGLETGIESIGYINEYGRQLESLKNIPNLQAVTMSGFSEKFRAAYPEFPEGNILKDNKSEWFLNSYYRENKYLGDKIIYKSEIAFADYFLPDNSGFLDRVLPVEGPLKKNSGFGTWGLLGAAGIIGILFYKFGFMKVWVQSIFFSFAAFGLILKSHEQYGWWVYYAGKFEPLQIFQIGAIVIPAIVSLGLRRIRLTRWIRGIRDINPWVFLLVFGVDPILQIARFTFLSGKYYLGIALDSLRFLGISYSKPFNFELVNQDFPSYQAAALLRLDFGKVWDNLLFTFVFYPFIHIFLAIVLGLILSKLPKKYSELIYVVLALFLIWHISNIINSDPRLVVPIR
jgi:hypothetical protein